MRSDQVNVRPKLIRRLANLGLLLVVATATGCLYPGLKMGGVAGGADGGTGGAAAGGNRASTGGAVGIDARLGTSGTVALEDGGRVLGTGGTVFGSFGGTRGQGGAVSAGGDIAVDGPYIVASTGGAGGNVKLDAPYSAGTGGGTGGNVKLDAPYSAGTGDGAGGNVKLDAPDSAGTGGGTGGSTSIICTRSTDNVCFFGGYASGGINLSNVNGEGWVALGAADTVTSPRCDNTTNGGGASEEITQAKPCAVIGGKSVWTNSDQGLCISGSIPIVTGDDYTNNWGMQIGMNISWDVGGTLGKSYSSITFNYTNAVTPPTSEIRGEIHVVNDPNLDGNHTNYCAVIQPGKAVSLSAFNTECWTDGVGKPMPASAVANIDKVGIQITSDTDSSHAVSNFCWSGFAFTP